jgi:hypothetical protein
MSVADSDPEAFVDFTSSIKGMESGKIRLKRPNYETEGFFTSWVRNKAMAACEFISDPIIRKEALASVTGEIASGYYDFEYDVTSGQKNYVHEAMRNASGTKEWCFFIIKQENIQFDNPDMRKMVLEPMWRDPAKRNEIIGKINMLAMPTPLTPPMEKAEAR